MQVGFQKFEYKNLCFFEKISIWFFFIVNGSCHELKSGEPLNIVSTQKYYTMFLRFWCQVLSITRKYCTMWSVLGQCSTISTSVWTQEVLLFFVLLILHILWFSFRSHIWKIRSFLLLCNSKFIPRFFEQLQFEHVDMSDIWRDLIIYSHKIWSKNG